MWINRDYQLWKVAKPHRDGPKDRFALVNHVMITHWPINLACFTEPSHGTPAFKVPGAYNRAENERRHCTCADCRAAHRLANRTASSPFYQADIVLTDHGIGVVYQTNETETNVDYPAGGVIDVRQSPTESIRLCWIDKEPIDDRPGVTTADFSLEMLINQRYAVAVATDGHSTLAVVPVELEDGDVPGLLQVGALHRAASLDPSQSLQIILRQDDAWIHSNRRNEGWKEPRFMSPQTPRDYFMDWEALLPAGRPHRGKLKVPAFSFDYRALGAVSEAIGAMHRRKVQPIRMTMTSDLSMSPVVLELTDSNVMDGKWMGKFKPPFGLLMPAPDLIADASYRKKGD